MLSAATLKVIQIYGIAIAISMFVAVIIKLLVVLTSRAEKKPPSANASPTPTAPIAQQPVASDLDEIPLETVAAASACISTIVGPHRIVSISQSRR